VLDHVGTIPGHALPTVQIWQHICAENQRVQRCMTHLNCRQYVCEENQRDAIAARRRMRRDNSEGAPARSTTAGSVSGGGTCTRSKWIIRKNNHWLVGRANCLSPWKSAKHAQECQLPASVRRRAVPSLNSVTERMSQRTLYTVSHTAPHIIKHAKRVAARAAFTLQPSWHDCAGDLEAHKRKRKD
jgi:hypothetical protein